MGLLTTIETEEQQLFTTYRAGRITPANLAQQLEALKVRRSSTLKPESSPPPLAPTAIMRSVDEYRQVFSERLQRASFEDRQYILRTLRLSCALETTKVVMKGSISAAGPAEDRPRLHALHYESMNTIADKILEFRLVATL